MRVTVQLFARLRDLAGSGTAVVEVTPPATIEDVWAALAVLHPAVAPFRPSLSAALNDDYARMSTAVAEGDSVAFLPPVSGG
ncbi:MAG: MoaD/ThiS family protein [Acidobacteria bacterium]|jgi:molybdopterin converting factor small subunit|nr:MoaD/ThiS family protein [Acidobacteriota bacterium]